MRNTINRTTIQGILYDHKLSLKVTGPNSKNPGTEFINGSISIATDDAMTNVVDVFYTYCTAMTNGGKENASFSYLKDIIEGRLGTYMRNGIEKAARVSIDSAIGLNDFYSNRNGQEELVSAKRNEGGFFHLWTGDFMEEKRRNEFECDMLITNCRRVEANPDRGIPEKVVLKGAIFDFRKALLPVEFNVSNPRAMDYFENLGATANNPVFTRVKGNQISQTLTRQIVEEGAWGESSVREAKSSHKEFLVNWAQGEPYLWDDESTITAEELKKAIADRELYLADVKRRNDEYKATKAASSNAPVAKPATGSGFSF